MLMARLVGVVFNESIVIMIALHMTDLDRLERNCCPDNFAVKIKQGIEFILKKDNSGLGRKEKYK